jgi:hypothetical protein
VATVVIPVTMVVMATSVVMALVLFSLRSIWFILEILVATSSILYMLLDPKILSIWILVV